MAVRFLDGGRDPEAPKIEACLAAAGIVGEILVRKDQGGWRVVSALLPSGKDGRREVTTALRACGIRVLHSEK
jgi:hypothetical protein